MNQPNGNTTPPAHASRVKNGAVGLGIALDLGAGVSAEWRDAFPPNSSNAESCKDRLAREGFLYYGCRTGKDNVKRFFGQIWRSRILSQTVRLPEYETPH